MAIEKTVRLVSHEEEEDERLAYWLSRTPEERIAEVERLRREYIATISGGADGSPEGLLGFIGFVKREES